jgi:hypothetical protein
MLLETMFSSGVLLVGVLGTLTLVDGANDRTAASKSREGATALARQLVEASRSIPYPQLTPASIEERLQEQPGLEDSGAGAGWTIRRRNFTYTVDAEVCTFDDSADGGGAHENSSYCTDSATGTLDGTPDDYRRVVVELQWDTGHGVQLHRQTTLVNNPGNAAAPAVKTLAVTAPSVPVTSDYTNVDFSATTSTAPQTVRWSVEGVPQGSASGSGTTWSFSWRISGVLDGSYLVGAQALDAQGRSGSSKALTVTLNRFLPLAPEGFAAGRNGGIVDIEWLPNSEGDIVGYRVYRQVGTGAPVDVCGLVTESVCKDDSPPDVDAVDYWAVAVDRAPDGSYREGTRSQLRTVTKANTRPFAPTDLTISVGTDGSATLQWAAPSPADPDSGDSIQFFRIYRDGVAYADRYDRTGLGTDLTWTDPAHNGDPHTYYVTAVDSQLAESDPVGPVGG